jgi:hypothetical protein
MDMKEAAAAYEAGSQYFLNLARAVTPDLMDVHAENEWSARQCIHHMADSEAQSYARLRRLVAEPEAQRFRVMTKQLGPMSQSLPMQMALLKIRLLSMQRYVLHP